MAKRDVNKKKTNVNTVKSVVNERTMASDVIIKTTEKLIQDSELAFIHRIIVWYRKVSKKYSHHNTPCYDSRKFVRLINSIVKVLVRRSPKKELVHTHDINSRHTAYISVYRLQSKQSIFLRQIFLHMKVHYIIIRIAWHVYVAWHSLVSWTLQNISMHSDLCD